MLEGGGQKSFRYSERGGQKSFHVPKLKFSSPPTKVFMNGPLQLDISHCYVTIKLLNIWMFPWCIYDPSLVKNQQSKWKIRPNVNPGKKGWYTQQQFMGWRSTLWKGRSLLSVEQCYTPYLISVVSMGIVVIICNKSSNYFFQGF